MSGTLQASVLKDSASATNNLALDASGNVTVGNNLTVSGTSAHTGNATFAGTVSATGTITGSSTIAAATGTLYPIVSGTAQASTSGTSITFTGIPSWAKRVTIMFNGVGISGTSNILFQVGSGSATTSGYLGSGWATVQTGSNQVATVTNGMVVNYAVAATRWNGQTVFSLLNSTGNIWTGSGILSSSTNTGFAGFSTTVPLSGALDRVVITTSNGTDTFVAGSINILYE
jgi:hypothetical protein